MNKGVALMMLGALLILVGLVLVILQFRKARTFPTRTVTLSPGRLNAKTTYPGIILIGIGALLALVGAALPN